MDTSLMGSTPATASLWCNRLYSSFLELVNRNFDQAQF
jgi:hypothetical protein